MEPPPRGIILGTDSLIMRKGPVAFVRKRSSQVAISVESSGRRFKMPALFTRMSRPPNVCSAWEATRAQSSGFRTSQAIGSARPPDSQIPEATRSSSPERRPVSTTAAPSAANRRATASPIPEPAPVMRATLSLKRPMARKGWSAGAGVSRGYGAGAGSGAGGVPWRIRIPPSSTAPAVPFRSVQRVPGPDWTSRIRSDSGSPIVKA